MLKILIILLITCFLAYLSQIKNPKDNSGKIHYDIYLIMLIVFLTLICGLRTNYNDTATYAQGFIRSTDFRTFISDFENFELLNNPLFYGFQALVRTFTDNTNVFFMICGIIVNYLNITFIKKQAKNEFFALSIFLYVTTGVLMLSCAAQKQSLAMAMLTLAIPYLFKRKYLPFYIIVFCAGLMHTYAWIFMVLPFFYSKPWSWKTFVLMVFVLTVMRSFQTIFVSLLEVADQIGKNIPYEEVFDNNRMNLFRVAVFMVLPMIALFFKSYLNRDIDNKTSLYVQMSIIAMMFMLLGTMNGANMFGRCGNYFIMGIILGLPNVIDYIFDKKSTNLIFVLAICCFVLFYYRDSQDFIYSYRYLHFIDFVKSLF